MVDVFNKKITNSAQEAIVSCIGVVMDIALIVSLAMDYLISYCIRVVIMGNITKLG